MEMRPIKLFSAWKLFLTPRSAKSKVETEMFHLFNLFLM